MMKKAKTIVSLIVLISLMSSGLVGAESKKIDIIYADPDYVTIKQELKGDKYQIDGDSRNLGAVDWVVYIDRLDPNEFDSKLDFFKKSGDNRTIYKSEVAVGSIYLEAKSLFRYFDLISLAINYAFNLVFNESITDINEIPADQDSIYVIRSYSGGWGKLLDSEEKSFVDKTPNGGRRDVEAFLINITAMSIDGVSAFIPLSKILPDDMNEMAKAGLMEAAKRIPILKEGGSTLKDLFRIFVDVSQAMFEKYVKGTAHISILKRYIGRARAILDLIDIPEKISKAGKAADRLVQMITVATPLETSYIVVGDPLALSKEGETKEKKKEISTSTEKVIATSSQKVVSDKITANIIDQNNEPMIGLDYWVIDSLDRKYGNAKTNSSGLLEIDIKSIPEGSYTLHIEKYNWDFPIKIPYCDTYDKGLNINGQGINLGTIQIQKWSKIRARLVDKSGNPMKEFNMADSFEVIDSFNNSTYYYPKYASHWGYLISVPNGLLETYPVPNGDYIFKIGNSWNSVNFVEKKVTIYNKDVDLGDIYIPY